MATTLKNLGAKWLSEKKLISCPALNVFDTDYQLEYNESYSGTVRQEIAIEGNQYCTSSPRAFESLRFESYNNFILIAGCITVIVIWGSKYLILM